MPVVVIAELGFCLNQTRQGVFTFSLPAAIPANAAAYADRVRLQTTIDPLHLSDPSKTANFDLFVSEDAAGLEFPASPIVRGGFTGGPQSQDPDTGLYDPAVHLQASQCAGRWVRYVTVCPVPLKFSAKVTLETVD
jgi:hypothetical protein